MFTRTIVRKGYATTIFGRGCQWTTNASFIRLRPTTGVAARKQTSFFSTTSLADAVSHPSEAFYTDAQKRIMQKTKDLHSSIMPLNEKVSCGCVTLQASDVVASNAWLCASHHALLSHPMRWYS